MNEKTMLLELLLAGFFAVACIKSWGPMGSSGKVEFGDLMRFPDRLERLRRSRWQWASMVALMLVLRAQGQLPLITEMTFVLQFLLFIALPVFKPHGFRTRGQESVSSVVRR